MPQKRWMLVVLVALVTGMATFAVAAKKDDKAAKMKPVTITGTLVDTKCYSMMPAANKGNDHMTETGQVNACATACANMGIPVAVLTDAGEVVVLVAPAASFASHMAHTARVTGVRAIDGHGLIVEKAEARGADGKWEEIKIVTMM